MCDPIPSDVPSSVPDSVPDNVIDRRIREDRRQGTTFLVRYHDAGDLIRDHAGELSSGRLFLPVHTECDAGDAVALELSFPGLLQPLRLAGIVASRVHKKKKGLRGLNIELSDNARAHLTAQIARIEQQDPDCVVRMVRVLVVDDNPHCAKLIQEGLHLAERRVFGHQVAFDVPTASTTADAIAFVRRKPIDVLIADIYLGGASGAAIIEHIRASDALRSIPVIAMSAGQDDVTRGVAVEAGADVFIEKPLRLKQVVDTVGRVLDLDGLRSQGGASPAPR